MVRIARPLWEDCRRLGLKLDYHSVPNTIDALYLIRHGETSGLNTLSPTGEILRKNPGGRFGPAQAENRERGSPTRAFDDLEDNVKRFFGQQTPLRFAWSVSLSPYSLPELDRIGPGAGSPPKGALRSGPTLPCR